MVAGVSRLKQLLEIFNRQASILNDTTHRVRIDRIVPGDGQNTCPLAHHNMFALANDTESRFL